MNIQRKIINTLILLALAIGAILPMHTAHASTLDNQSTSKSCGVGYVKKNGKCVKIPITGNDKLSRLAYCLTHEAQTVKQFNACMARK